MLDKSGPAAKAGTDAAAIKVAAIAERIPKRFFIFINTPKLKHVQKSAAPLFSDMENLYVLTSFRTIPTDRAMSQKPTTVESPNANTTPKLA